MVVVHNQRDTTTDEASQLQRRREAQPASVNKQVYVLFFSLSFSFSFLHHNFIVCFPPSSSVKRGRCMQDANMSQMSDLWCGACVAALASASVPVLGHSCPPPRSARSLRCASCASGHKKCRPVSPHCFLAESASCAASLREDS